MKMLPSEAVWGYEVVTAGYIEEPAVSWQRIMDRIKERYPDAEESEMIRLIGKRPEE